MVHVEIPLAGDVSGDITQVSGWALSPHGIEAVEIYCDGHRTRNAELGIERPDLAARFPDLEIAHRCGFRAFLRSEGIGAGMHVVSVSARDGAGNRLTMTVPFEVEGPFSAYEEWLSRIRPSGADLRWMRDHAGQFPARPCFTVHITGETGHALESTVRSLCRQAWPYWNVTLPEGAVPGDLLARIGFLDLLPRFAATRSAAVLAHDVSFVAKLDAGDLLSPDCLFEFALRIVLDPNLDLLYADHDSIDSAGHRHSLHVLPEWKPSAFESLPCLARFLAVRRELADGVSKAFCAGAGGLAQERERLRLLSTLVRRASRVALPLVTLGDRQPALCGKLTTASGWKPVAEPPIVLPLYSSSSSLEPWEVRSLLVVKVDHIGDMVLALPAFRLLRRRFPRAKIVGLVSPWVLPVVLEEPLVDAWETLNLFDPDSRKPRRTLSPGERADLRNRLRAHHFDMAIDLRPSGETSFLLSLSGAPAVASFQAVVDAAGSALLAPHVSMPLTRREGPHMTDRLVCLVEAVSPADTGGVRHVAPPTPSEREEAGRLLDALTGGTHPFRVGFHPGGKIPLHHWSDEGFAGLADLCARELGAQIVFFGGARDADEIHRIQSMMKEHSWSAAGSFLLQEFLKAVVGCRLFVGNDSGPAHVAAAVGVPTIAVFSGIVDPRTFAPRGLHAMAIRADVPCSPCGLTDPLHCRWDRICASSISASHVFQFVRGLLAATSGIWKAGTIDAGPDRTVSSPGNSAIDHITQS